jgi:hypothetical protein
MIDRDKEPTFERSSPFRRKRQPLSSSPPPLPPPAPPARPPEAEYRPMHVHHPSIIIWILWIAAILAILYGVSQVLGGMGAIQNEGRGTAGVLREQEGRWQVFAGFSAIGGGIGLIVTALIADAIAEIRDIARRFDQGTWPPTPNGPQGNVFAATSNAKIERGAITKGVRSESRNPIVTFLGGLAVLGSFVLLFKACVIISESDDQSVSSTGAPVVHDHDKPFVDAGFKLCDAFHRTGMVNHCNVIRDERVVDVDMRVRITEGPDVVCQGSAIIQRQHVNFFRGTDWRLRIDGKECLLG